MNKASVRIGFDRPESPFAPHAGVVVIRVNEPSARLVLWAGMVLGKALEIAGADLDMDGVKWVCERREQP